MDEKLIEQALSLIDDAEQAMIAERKKQYGSTFKHEQEVAIRQKFAEQKRGVAFVGALDRYIAVKIDAALTNLTTPKEGE